MINSDTPSLTCAPFVERRFFRGGRSAIFPLALTGFILLMVALIVATYSISFAQYADPYSNPTGGDKSGSTKSKSSGGGGGDSGSEANERIVEPRQEVQERQEIQPRDAVQRP